jgi:hypothetical protein
MFYVIFPKILRGCEIWAFILWTVRSQTEVRIYDNRELAMLRDLVTLLLLVSG